MKKFEIGVRRKGSDPSKAITIVFEYDGFDEEDVIELLRDRMEKEFEINPNLLEYEILGRKKID